MGFSEKAKQYFHKQLNLTNREIAKRMDNYNEVLVSRCINSDKLSPTFLKKIQKYFPEADINWLISDDENKTVNEPREKYTIDVIKKIDKVISELKEIKIELSRK